MLASHSRCSWLERWIGKTNGWLAVTLQDAPDLPSSADGIWPDLERMNRQRFEAIIRIAKLLNRALKEVKHAGYILCRRHPRSWGFWQCGS
jgi:hypothetical protein